MNFVIIYNVILFLVLMLIIWSAFLMNKVLAVILYVIVLYCYYRHYLHVDDRYFVNKIDTQFEKIAAEKARDIRDLKILDFGSGSSCILAKKFPDLNITSMDIMPSKEDNYIQYNGDVKRLPFDDKAFDIVICCFVIHHIEDQQSIIKELKRISKYIIIYEDDLNQAPWSLLARSMARSHYTSFDQDPKCIKYMHTPNKWKELFSCKLRYSEKIPGIFTYGFIPHICLIFQV